ncbi:hypothetical protein C8R45DRAFT_1136753 [Mycena sanguinolenta]|nr:hypothetical protein C8R45DRAFT_1136753 [Mycena sanguinolenta]
MLALCIYNGIGRLIESLTHRKRVFTSLPPQSSGHFLLSTYNISSIGVPGAPILILNAYFSHERLAANESLFQCQSSAVSASAESHSDGVDLLMPRPFLPYHDVPSRSLLTPIHYDPRTARGTQMTMEKWEMGFEWLLMWYVVPFHPTLPHPQHAQGPRAGHPIPRSPRIRAVHVQPTHHSTRHPAHAVCTCHDGYTRCAIALSPGLRTRCAWLSALLLVPMSMHGVLFALTAPADERARWNNVLRAPGLARYARGRTQPTYSQYM